MINCWSLDRDARSRKVKIPFPAPCSTQPLLKSFLVVQLMLVLLLLLCVTSFFPQLDGEIIDKGPTFLNHREKKPRATKNNILLTWNQFWNLYF